MNRDESTTALDIAVRLITIVQTEQREATYKQALSIALIQQAIRAPKKKEVSLKHLADRFVDLYWGQRDPFEGRVLDQNKAGEPRILKLIDGLKAVADKPGCWKPGRPRVDRQYLKVQRQLAQAVAQMPATHLQGPRPYRSESDFLYESAWLHKKVTIEELESHNWMLCLKPGVAAALVKTSALTIPAIQRFWEDDVKRFNRELLKRNLQLAERLFGSDRISLGAVRAPLSRMQLGKCFYCGARLGSKVHVDHVIPWSRCGSNDLANLVADDPTCNARKSNALPTTNVIEAAVSRNGLVDLAKDQNWECHPDFVRRMGGALFEAAAPGSRFWDSEAKWAEKTV